MRKTIIKVLITIVLIIMMFAPTINATKYQVHPEYYESSRYLESETFKFGGRVAGIIQIVGTIVSIGALIVIGIRYAVSSVEDKAEYKERMLPYIIGCVLLFGSTNIVNILYKFSEFDTETTSLQASIDISKYKYDNNYFFCPHCNKRCKKELITHNLVECMECKGAFIGVSGLDTDLSDRGCNLCPVCGYWYEIWDDDLTCYHCNWNYNLTITASQENIIGTCTECGNLTRADIEHPVSYDYFCLQCHKKIKVGVYEQEEKDKIFRAKYGNVNPTYEECFEDKDVVIQRYEEIAENRAEQGEVTIAKCKYCGNLLDWYPDPPALAKEYYCLDCEKTIDYDVWVLYDCYNEERTCGYDGFAKINSDGTLSCTKCGSTKGWFINLKEVPDEYVGIQNAVGI